jgi:hypothetical protein
MLRSEIIGAVSERSCSRPYAYEIEAPESFYDYRPYVVRPVFLAGCAAFGTFTASGLAPHLGQATTSLLRS